MSIVARKRGRPVDIAGHGDIVRQEREGKQETEERPGPPPSAPVSSRHVFLVGSCPVHASSTMQSARR
jgi:hypothetical protein